MNHSDPFDLQSQERATAGNSDKAKLAHQVEIDALKWLMSNKRGRRFVCRQLERAGVWRISFNTNALTMAFNEGMRNEGLRLMAQITTHCADRYTEMLKESKEP
jgi:hypothetical protein